jgi:hypothetical protein
MKHLQIATLIALMSTLSLNAEENGQHLFILSGQSNMERLDPKVSFTPTMEAAFGKNNVIVIKDALKGQPIRRWYKDWKPAEGNQPKATGDLYDRLMEKVNSEIQGKEIKTVTFIWMQGERDAKEKFDDVYKQSLLGLIKQLSNDLNRDDVNFVIGRLSKVGKDEHWEGIRKAQVATAESSPRGAWVDTDDVDISGIHYTEAGYKDLGKRFAEKAIALINKKYAQQ